MCCVSLSISCGLCTSAQKYMYAEIALISNHALYLYRSDIELFKVQWLPPMQQWLPVPILLLPPGKMLEGEAEEYKAYSLWEKQEQKATNHNLTRHVL